MRRWSTIAMSLALGVPPVAVLTAFAASGAAALTTGQPLFWPAQPVTLTEAIGMHDTGEIVRQIALGANPNIRYDTWDILKRYQHVSVTPLEAAVATREQYLFETIIAHGALLTLDNARTLYCFAVQEHATDIAAYVAARFPPPASCEGVQLPW
ncbi:MAG TPA: hypothetical protein VKA59_20955 [Vicinamibacterales bacterium]|nr:hypothetical protein [Vicinamibacterales bacterium]